GELRGPGAGGRRVLPQRAHLLLGRDDPTRGQALLRRARSRRIPDARPRRVALAHHRHLHPDPLPRRDDLPEAAAGAPVSKVRGLVVDGSAFVRQALTRMLGSAADIEVVGMAVDGKDGVDKVKELRPDVVTMDIQMPRMGGLEALQKIMVECPTPVLL